MKKKLLVVAMAATMAVAGAMTAFADAPDDYEAYFSFDETLEDASGNYTAEPVGKAFSDADKTADDFTYVDGTINKAIEINTPGTDEDGNTTYDNVGLGTGVNITGDYTISFVATSNTAAFAAPIVWIGSTDQATDGEHWHGFWNGFGTTWVAAEVEVSASDTSIAYPGFGSNSNDTGRMGIQPTTALNGATSSSFTATVITWTYEAASGTVNLYYDGVLVGTLEGAATLSDDAYVWIGANYWDSPTYFTIDELYIYTRVLDEDEIASVVSASGVMSDEEKESLEAYVEESSEIAESERISSLAAAQESRNAATADSSDDSSDTSSDSNSNTTTIVVVVVVIVIVVVVVVAVVLGSKKKKK